MKRHVSAEKLASLDLGGLSRRKAARVRAHLVTCTVCTQIHQQLASVSVVLSSVQFASMPDHLSLKVESAIAAQSRVRLATEPATEAERGALPARARHASRRGFGERLSGPGLRIVAAVGALAIIVGGGYEIISHVGGRSSSPTASSAGSSNVEAAPLTTGPGLTYHHAGHDTTVRMIGAATNFVPSNLGNQVTRALSAAKAQSDHAASGAAPNAPAATKSATVPQRTLKGLRSQAFHGIPISRLEGCVNKVASGHTVLLVEVAYYEHQPATLIVVAAAIARHAEVWIVSTECGPSALHVLKRLALANI